MTITCESNLPIRHLAIDFFGGFQRHIQMIIAEYCCIKGFTLHCYMTVLHHDIRISEGAVLGVLNSCYFRQLHKR